MTPSELILSQLADPLRIALIIGLLYTMIRNRAVSGTWIPLAAGIVFVAVLLAATRGGELAEPMQMQIITGLVSNVVLTGIFWGLWELYSRFRR